MYIQNLLNNPWKLFNYCISRCLCSYSFSNNNSIVYSKSSERSRHQKLNVFPSLWSVPNLKFHSSFRFFGRELPVEDPSQPMVKMIFILPDGEEIELKGRAGITVMQEAVRNKLPMEALCDGQCSCTSCHLYVEDCVRIDSGTENPYLGYKSLEEEDMLDNEKFCMPNSRLSCQLIISKDCESARFRFPAATCNISVGEPRKDQN